LIWFVALDFPALFGEKGFHFFPQARRLYFLLGIYLFRCFARFPGQLAFFGAVTISRFPLGFQQHRSARPVLVSAPPVFDSCCARCLSSRCMLGSRSA
jgi:hypothetical protein